jgi:zinc transporter ZupT
LLARLSFVNEPSTICRRPWLLHTREMSLAGSILLAGSLIGAAALAAGALIVRKGLVRAPSALLLCFPAGLLVGMGLLVVLPEALEELTQQHGWSVSNVLLLFMCGVLGMFLLEHCMLVHEHNVQPGQVVLLRSGPANGVATEPTATELKQLAPPPASPPTRQDTDALQTCAPCRGEREEPIAPAPPAVPPAPRETQPAADGDSPVLPLWASQCECCEPGSDDLAWLRKFTRGTSTDVESANPSPTGGGELREQSRCATRLVVVGKVLHAVTRVGAWLLHTLLDGMVLGSARTVGSLAPLSAAILLCVLQDVAAFCLVLRRVSPLAMAAAIVAMAFTIP